MKFKINPREEAEKIPILTKNLTGKFILVPSIKKIIYKISKEDLYFKIKEMHKGKGKQFKKIKEAYETIWKKKGGKYLLELEKILENKLDINKIGYIVPSLWVNIADVIGRKNAFFVAEEFQQTPLEFLLFHELTHLHYADTLIKLRLEEAGKSPLMEGVDHLILFKSPIKKLFKSVKYEDIQFVQINSKFMRELENLWNKRKDFESFLKKAIKVQRKIKDVIIC